MRKIFLDVGGHNGQTLNEILSGKYSFDKVYCFEPMPNQINYLNSWFTEKGKPYGLEILNYGLLDETCQKIIYGTNEDMSASIFKDKNNVSNINHETICKFVSVSDFFKENIKEDDLVIMKLNCEGSEVIIINALLESGQLNKVSNMMIDFDIRKVNGHQHEADELLEKLKLNNYSNYSLEGDVMIGNSHVERIANWLSTLPFYDRFLTNYFNPMML